MADLDNIRFDLKRLHLQQAHQNSNLKDFTWHLFNDYPFVFKSSHVTLHSFIVDWEIPESENDEKTHEFRTA